MRDTDRRRRRPEPSDWGLGQRYTVAFLNNGTPCIKFRAERDNAGCVLSGENLERSLYYPVKLRGREPAPVPTHRTADETPSRGIDDVFLAIYLFIYFFASSIMPEALKSEHRKQYPCVNHEGLSKNLPDLYVMRYCTGC